MYSLNSTYFDRDENLKFQLKESGFEMTRFVLFSKLRVLKGAKKWLVIQHKVAAVDKEVFWADFTDAGELQFTYSGKTLTLANTFYEEDQLMDLVVAVNGFEGAGNFVRLFVSVNGTFVENYDFDLNANTGVPLYTQDFATNPPKILMFETNIVKMSNPEVIFQNDNLQGKKLKIHEFELRRSGLAGNQCNFHGGCGQAWFDRGVGTTSSP